MAHLAPGGCRGFSSATTAPASRSGLRLPAARHAGRRPGSTAFWELKSFPWTFTLEFRGIWRGKSKRKACPLTVVKCRLVCIRGLAWVLAWGILSPRSRRRCDLAGTGLWAVRRWAAIPSPCGAHRWSGWKDQCIRSSISALAGSLPSGPVSNALVPPFLPSCGPPVLLLPSPCSSPRFRDTAFTLSSRLFLHSLTPRIWESVSALQKAGCCHGGEGLGGGDPDQCLS